MKVACVLSALALALLPSTEGIVSVRSARPPVVRARVRCSEPTPSCAPAAPPPRRASARAPPLGALVARATRSVLTRRTTTARRGGARPAPRSLHSDAAEQPLDAAAPASRLGASRVGLRQRLQRARKWASSASAAYLVFFTMSPAFAARKPPAPVQEPRGRIEISFNNEPRELSPSEKAMCVALSGAAAAGLLYWGKVSGDDEDRAEQKRIKDEYERLKKMQDEFLLDDDVVVDEDLFSSLRKRMEKAGDGVDGPQEPPNSPGDSMPDEPPPKPTPPAPSALSEPTAPPPPRPAPPPPAADAKPPAAGADDDPVARDADIERLKRMFGNS